MVLTKVDIEETNAQSFKKRRKKGGHRKMEMCYDGALVMPSNYAVMSEDEMMYVDGGVKASVKLWGVQIKFTGRDAEGLALALAAGSGATWLAAELGAPTVVGGIGIGAIAAMLTTAAAAVGGINWLKKGKGFNYNILWNGFNWIS